jgi:hypothetical protein
MAFGKRGGGPFEPTSAPGANAGDEPDGGVGDGQRARKVIGVFAVAALFASWTLSGGVYDDIAGQLIAESETEGGISASRGDLLGIVMTASQTLMVVAIGFFILIGVISRLFPPERPRQRLGFVLLVCILGLLGCFMAAAVFVAQMALSESLALQPEEIAAAATAVAFAASGLKLMMLLGVAALGVMAWRS